MTRYNNASDSRPAAECCKFYDALDELRRRHGIAADDEWLCRVYDAFTDFECAHAQLHTINHHTIDSVAVVDLIQSLATQINGMNPLHRELLLSYIATNTTKRPT